MSEVEGKLKVLSRIAQALNARSLTWAVGGSLLLYIKGIVSDFHDIDIMVAEADADAAQAVLSSLGGQLPVKPKDRYRSKRFLSFRIDGVDVDVIAGFTIIYEGEEHYFPLIGEEIKDHAEIDGTLIPLQSLGAWRRYYRLMGRDDKAALLEGRE